MNTELPPDDTTTAPLLGLGSSAGLGLVERLRRWPDLPGLNLDRDLMREAAAEIERLTAALKTANEQTERFERGWYLRGDALEAVKEAATTQRGLDFNLTAEQWAAFHDALRA